MSQGTDGGVGVELARGLMPGKFGKLTLHREAVAERDGLAMQGDEWLLERALLLQVSAVDPACLAGGADIEVAVGLGPSQCHRATSRHHAQDRCGRTRLSSQVHVIGRNRLRSDR